MSKGLDKLAEEIGVVFDDGVDENAKVEALRMKYEELPEKAGSAELAFSLDSSVGTRLAKTIRRSTHAMMKNLVSEGKLSTQAANKLMKAATNSKTMAFAINGNHQIDIDAVFDALELNGARVSDGAMTGYQGNDEDDEMEFAINHGGTKTNRIPGPLDLVKEMRGEK